MDDKGLRSLYIRANRFSSEEERKKNTKPQKENKKKYITTLDT
jgi:hypothetical protein